MDWSGGLDVSGVIDEVSSRVVTPPRVAGLPAPGSRRGTDRGQSSTILPCVCQKVREKKRPVTVPTPLLSPLPEAERGRKTPNFRIQEEEQDQVVPVLLPLSASGRGRGEGFCRSVPKYRDRFRHPCLTREK